MFWKGMFYEKKKKIILEDFCFKEIKDVMCKEGN